MSASSASPPEVPAEARAAVPAEAGASIAIDGITVRYPAGRVPALADVSVAVDAGEVVAVTGRTGAGKSTLALAAAGFIPRVVRARVDGRVLVAGLDAMTARAGELATRVGIVFSTPANQLSASKPTVREELAFGLENLGVPRAEMDGRIDAVLAGLGIEALADREPLALSGGEQQRVAIASILAMGTSVLVLDEPTAQLDPAGTRMVADLLRSLAAGGRPVLVAEHDPTVLAMAGGCLVLEAGRRVALDVPGMALSAATLGPLGLATPTLVRIAELAGLPPSLAFDEAAIATALGSLGAEGLATDPGAMDASAAPAVTGWSPVIDRPPVAVEVAGLTHRYPGGVEALRGVDLELQPGVAVAIVGQNGSGKTTLARHLDGLLRPDAGSVRVGGRDIAADPVSTVARTVGFVFQDPDEQLFERSVEREVGFGPRNLGLDARTAAILVDRAIALTGLEEVRSANPYDLGLSVRKLVALASVLAMEPAVFILDEPTTGQDGPGSARIGSIVDALVAAGRTVIAISHDMEFVARHFRRVVVMREGRVVADDTPAEVFAPAATALLASTGLVPPPAARLGAALGLGSTPTEAALRTALLRRAALGGKAVPAAGER
jgi:energy-coupling factor transporter ATP-binding protein EcfA2